MRRTRAAALYLVALFVTVGFNAASAAGAPPEFQAENTRTGKLEPVGKPVKFQDEGEGTSIRSESGFALTCASSSGTGKLTGPKTLTEKTTYTGCETHGAGGSTTCQSGRTPGEVRSRKLDGMLVSAQNGEFLVPAIELEPASGTALLKFKCGASKVVVAGSVLGEILPLEEATMRFAVTFATAPEPIPGCGTQQIQLIEGIGSCRHLDLESEGKTEPAGAQAAKEYVGHVTLICNCSKEEIKKTK